MGQQASSNSWSVDDWAFGTGTNMVSMQEAMDETSKLPKKLFGGETIEKDSSMLQVQSDLLSIDETIKKLFRRKKSKKSKKNNHDYAYYDESQRQDGYYYEDDQYDYDGQPAHAVEDSDYLEPIAISKDLQTREENQESHKEDQNMKSDSKRVNSKESSKRLDQEQVGKKLIVTKMQQDKEAETSF